MEKFSLFLCALVLVLGVTAAANSALIDRKGGLIYDDVLDVTWLQDANYAGTTMTWDDAFAWANGLEYYDSVRDVTWDDWRLPQTLPVNASNYDYNWHYDGSVDRGYNISAPGSAYPGSTGSEMSYMFYNNLGNLGYYDTSGNYQPDFGLKNIGPFNNLQPSLYWSCTEYGLDPECVWVFRFYYGRQNYVDLNHDYYAWAVRDSDVGPVPIPSAVWLLGSGLIVFVGIHRTLRKEAI